MNEFLKYYAKWKKAVTKEDILWTSYENLLSGMLIIF